MNTTAVDDQALLWNGPAGQAWVDAQQLLDETLKPFEDLLVAEVSGGRVLDVGCGTGSTTLAVARRAEGVGVDVSAPMIAAARARAEAERSTATFVCADAATHAFEPATFHTIMSRFGVMFFSDPVAAFTNLRRATTQGADLRFVAWRSPAENPFMTTAERAVGPILPPLPPREPDAPGQFAFADEHRVERILAQSGWSEIELEPIDVVCSFPASGLLQYATRLGPVGRVLQEVDDATRARAIDMLQDAFAPFVQGDTARFTAACWWVSARSPS
jgi:SAM-dependent methyltransferase